MDVITTCQTPPSPNTALYLLGVANSRYLLLHNNFMLFPHSVIPSRLSCTKLVQAFRQSPTKQMKHNSKICDIFLKQNLNLSAPPLPLSMLRLIAASKFGANIDRGSGVCFIYFCRGVYLIHMAIIGVYREKENWIFFKFVIICVIKIGRLMTELRR